MKLEYNKESLTHNLALIQWYDFKSDRNPYYYRCPRLKGRGNVDQFSYDFGGTIGFI